MTEENNTSHSRKEDLSYRLEGGADYPLLKVILTAGTRLQVEYSSIVGQEGDLDVHPPMNAVASRVVTEDSLLVNRFQAKSASGSVLIAPVLPGHILHHRLTTEQIFTLRKSAFLASSPNLQLIRMNETQRGLFPGSGLLLLQCKGTGDLWFNSYGAAHRLDVDGEIVADADKIVAWTNGLTCRQAPLNGYRTSWFIGEGLGCHFQGEGSLWLQSRSSRALLHRMRDFRATKPPNYP